MNQEVLKSRVFTIGEARYHDLVYILSKDKSLMSDDTPHISVIGIDLGKWVDCDNTNWNSTAIALAEKPAEKLVIIGEDGEVLTYVGGEAKLEKTLPKVSMIRSANNIDGYVYACGMKRQVFKRTGENKWSNISAPVSKKNEKVGFESIDGYSENEIYAVGWNGEIWKYDGKSWENCANLTNLILTSVCCAKDGVVYVAGQQGVLLKGRHDQWDIVEWKDDVAIDFWGLSFYENNLYISSIDSLFIYNGGHLLDVDFDGLEITSCYSLTQAEDIMWSIGANDVLSFDGKKWIKYT